MPLLALILYLGAEPILARMGRFLVSDDLPQPADAVVVLLSGVEYFPRLVQAAELYRSGFVRHVVINGNRKTDSLRHLEQKGFEACCPWYENPLRVLSLFGVPREKVIKISAENAFDTLSEAEIVGNQLVRRHIARIMVTTSKYHTRRAGFIWKTLFDGRLSIRTIAAGTDPFDPDAWWREGRQVRWVMAEYGAWVYYLWKSFFEI